MNRTMTALEWALLVVLSVLWGTSFFSLSFAARDLPPFTIVTLKVILAAAALFAVLRLAGGRIPRGRRTWSELTVMGLFNDAGPFILIAFASPYVATGLMSVLIATSPLFTVVLAHVLTTDERMTARHAVGVLMGFAGLAVMLGGGAIGLSVTDILAQLACLGAALGYAYASVYGRRFTPLGLHPMAIAGGQLASSAILLAPVALLIDQPWTLPMPGWPAIAGMLSMALLSGALAYSIFFRILATAGATNVVLVTFLSPITAILIGIVALGEHVTTHQMAGMALIALGIAVLDGRPVRALLARARVRPATR